jgi:hypothetical protein
LLEQEHLTGAQEMDARYHLAKLFGLMMTEEGAKYAWQEHREIRERLMTAQAPAMPAAPPPAPPDVLSIHRRLVDAGLVPRSGEMH